MTWVHILIEIGGYGLAIVFGMIAWARLDVWFSKRGQKWISH